MTGEEIRALRRKVGLNVEQFADVLGVGLSTAYKWESLGSVEVRVGVGVERLLQVVQLCSGVQGLGAELRGVLAQPSGGLRAQHVLLSRYCGGL